MVEARRGEPHQGHTGPLATKLGTPQKLFILQVL